MRCAPRFAFLIVFAPVLAFTMCCFGKFGVALAYGQAPASSAQALPSRAPVGSDGYGTPFKADKLNQLLPATVYFQGKTAPLQLRNAGGSTLSGGVVVWAALVDSSGYASSLQERYQFYLVTEAPLLVGGSRIAAGAYGGGFVGDRFLVMDLGGHTVAEGSTEVDPGLARPRPLQFLPEAPNAVKLFLGRRWVELRSEGVMR